MIDDRYWTSLEELAAGCPPSKEAASAAQSDARILLESIPSVDRRGFLKLMGVSLAAGALSGCRKPAEKIIPYLVQPAEITPSVASWYATTCHGCSAACGALAKVVDGRPIKFEGNPDHAASRGGLCAVGQAAVLGLYDAYRQKAPAARGAAATWEQIDREIGGHLATARAERRKVVLLTGTITGPATRAVVDQFVAAFPRAEHVVYDAVSAEAIREAHRLAYGRPLIPGYRFDRAEVIVSFGADFLGTWLSPVEFAKQYSSGRNLADRTSGMSRHYQLESRLSLTGSNADHRIPMAPSEQASSAAALLAHVAQETDAADPRLAALVKSARELAGPHPLTPSPRIEGGATESGPLAGSPSPEVGGGGQGVGARLRKIAGALLKARGRCLVVSDSDEVPVQMAVLALNELLGNVGHTVDLERPSLQKQGRDAQMARLIGEMQRGEVGALLIHGCNPAYTWPEAEAFASALKHVPCTISFAASPDETTALATHHCPTHHPMEAWGDAEPTAGRLSLFQPTIRPLYQTRAFEESLLKWSGHEQSFHDYLQQHWQTHVFPHQKGAASFTAFWDQMLQKGYLELTPPGVPALTPPPAARVPGSPEKDRERGERQPSPDTVPPLPAVFRRGGQGVRAGAAPELAHPSPQSGTLEIELFESVALRDGALANNPWLHELPDPITKIAWDNCALIAPSLALEKRIAEGQWLEIRAGGRALRVPAHLQPGQHPRTISIALGYGRSAAGPVGNGVGVNAAPLLAIREGRRWRTGAVEALRVLPPGGGPAGKPSPYSFAQTQLHSSMEGRPIVRETSYQEFREGKPLEAEAPPSGADLWGKHDYPEYKWGMVIDLTKCTGCSACVTACDIENNIPVVGREEVGRQREMHWLRIDRYFTGDPEAPEVAHQPMLCQQCDNASCETVCPALATVHDDQGLNLQVYNRCVGTRYCANNCPYKARRFNFFNNVSNDLTQNLALNPDVMVRSRGVMEKCTFCVQRIQAARIEAREEGRSVRDGEVQTACEQSCPADAIVFGNLKDLQSGAARQSTSARGYRVLEELNRQPSVYYLARVRNRDEQEA